MYEDVIAKNLLMNKSCYNCKHASSLANRNSISSNFEKNTGFPIDTIHDGSFIGDMLFMCSRSRKLLPRELSCQYWEQEHE